MAGGGGFMSDMVGAIKNNRKLLKDLNKNHFINNDSLFHKGDMAKRKRRDEKALKNINKKSLKYISFEKIIYLSIIIVILVMVVSVSICWLNLPYKD